VYYLCLAKTDSGRS